MENNNSGGIGLLGATFIVFLVLKLTGPIEWSWWWVTAPLWGPAAILTVFAIVGGILGGILGGLGALAAKAVKK